MLKDLCELGVDGRYVYKDSIIIEVVKDCYFNITGFCSNDLPSTLRLPSVIGGLKANKILTSAFFSCNSLNEVIVEEGYREIDYESFAYSSIKKISLPSTLIKIDIYAFRGCMSLKSIQVSKDNRFFDSRCGCNAIIYTPLNHLIIGCKNSDIVPGIKSIEYTVFVHGFAGRTERIIIPGTVEEIDGCGSLRNTQRCLAVLKLLIIENPAKIKGLNHLICNIVSPGIVIAMPKKYTGIKYKFDKNNCTFRYYHDLPNIPSYSSDGFIIPKVNDYGVNSYSDEIRIYDKYYDIETEELREVLGIDAFAFSGCKGLNKIIIPKKIKDNINSLAFEDYDGEIEYV